MAQLMWHGFRFDGRAGHESSLFEPIPPGMGSYLSKKPPDTIRIRTVFLRDPELFVIAMVRDPRAVITSRHERKPDVYFSSFWRWERYVEAIEALREHPRYLIVRYEDLVADPDAVQQHIAERFPSLERIRLFTRYPEGADIPEKARISLNGIRPVDRQGLERWRQELPRLKGEVLRHPELAAWLRRFGYEENDEWSRCLDGVEPVHQSYKNELPGALRRTEASVRFAFKTVLYLRRRRLLFSHAA